MHFSFFILMFFLLRNIFLLLVMDNFDLHLLLTFQENNMKFDLLCPNGYNNNLNEMDIQIF
jgi:hypothetical protein